MIPPPNEVTLSFDKGIDALARCRVVARVRWNNFLFSGYPVDFVLVSGPGKPPASGVTDANGELRRTLAPNQLVEAQAGVPGKVLTSKSVGCNLRIKPQRL